MRRFLLLVLPLVALVPAAPGTAGVGACVSSRGVTACPHDVMRCTPGDIVKVTVTGFGSGVVACGDAERSCSPLRGVCTVEARTTTAGIMSCDATGNAVATCSIEIQVTH